MSLGLERAGMTSVGFCEIDPFCREVLQAHWPEVWIHDDVRTLTTPLIRERCGHVDECGTINGVGLADSECPRLEGFGSDAGQPQIAESGDAGAHRWPARPGEPQHDWEAPRLVELPLGGKLNGVPVRLVRSHNKHALKALGNAVVPQVVEAIGRAILAVNQLEAT